MWAVKVVLNANVEDQLSGYSYPLVTIDDYTQAIANPIGFALVRNTCYLVFPNSSLEDRDGISANEAIDHLRHYRFLREGEGYAYWSFGFDRVRYADTQCEVCNSLFVNTPELDGYCFFHQDRPLGELLSLLSHLVTDVRSNTEPIPSYPRSTYCTCMSCRY